MKIPVCKQSCPRGAPLVPCGVNTAGKKGGRVQSAAAVMVVFLMLTTGGLYAQQMNLGQTIIAAARSVEDVLPENTMVAVLNFETPSEAFSQYVLDELTGELVNGKKLTVVDRANLALITQEMHLQLSGDVSDESAQAVGRLLGAQSIISGGVTNMGSFHRFRIRVISVETATIQTQVSLNLQNDEQVAFLLGGDQEKVPPVAPARRPDPVRQPIKIIMPTQSEVKTVKAKNNWISGELAFLGVGLRYERMLGSQMSIGAHAYLNYTYVITLDDPFAFIYSSEQGAGEHYNIGVEAAFRWYPGGYFFFVGAAMGYHNINYSKATKEILFSDYESHNIHGFGITPELGVRIDPGEAGGFFLQPGLALSLLFGDMSESGFALGAISPRIFLAMGAAF